MNRQRKSTKNVFEKIVRIRQKANLVLYVSVAPSPCVKQKTVHIVQIVFTSIHGEIARNISIRVKDSNAVKASFAVALAHYQLVAVVYVYCIISPFLIWYPAELSL